TALSGNYTVTEGRYTSDEFFTLATILLIFEMLVVYYVAFKNLKNKRNKMSQVKNDVILKNSQFILIIFVIVAITIVLIKPGLLREYNFVFTMPAKSNNLDEINSGF